MMAMCSITAVAMLMSIFNIITTVLLTRFFSHTSSMRIGSKVFMKPREKGHDWKEDIPQWTEAQKLVQMAVASREYIVSTDRWEEVYLTLFPILQAFFFFEWREFSWELKSHCCVQLIPCLQFKIAELYIIYCAFHMLWVCFFLIVSVPIGIH